jgi:hypothetical protein
MSSLCVPVLFVSQIKVSNSALVSTFMKELEPESPVSQVCIFISKEYDIFVCRLICMS